MSDVAQRSGVSLSTVSHVLNRTRKVSESARTAVLQAAQDLGFLDERLRKAIRPASTIGVVVPSSPYFGEFVEGLSAESFRRDVDLLMMTSGEDIDLEHRAVTALLERNVDGIIMIPTTGWEARTRPLLRHHEVPLVVVDRLVDDHVDQVGVENTSATEALVSHLLSLKHKRIGLVRGLAGLSTTIEREEGYRNAHRRHDIAVDESLIVDGLSSVRGGRSAIEQLMLLPSPPTALFCANNNMTMGALSALRQLDIALPDEVALVAFDDLEWSDILRPGITSMAQPFHAMGSRALQLVLDRLESPASAPQTVRLPPSFEHRESCGCDFDGGLPAARPAAHASGSKRSGRPAQSARQ